MLKLSNSSRGRLVVLPILLASLGCSLVNGLAPGGASALAGLSPTPLAVSPTASPSATAVAPGYIPPRCANLPLATTAPDLLQATPILPTAAPLASSVQESVFNSLIKAVTDTYLYPDFHGTDWSGNVAEAKAKLQAGMSADGFYAEMGRLIDSLGDDHSQFQSPAVAAASDAELAGHNEFVGIGVVVKPMADKGLMTILAVFPDSSAAHAGLQPHDNILAIDGIPIVEGDVARPGLVRGPQCSLAILRVDTPGQPARDLAIVRDRVDAPEPIDARLVPTTDGTKIGYIFLPSVFDETFPHQVRSALESFGPLDGLIIDNRMNSGGSSDVVTPILSFFTSGTLGHFVSRTSNRPLNVKATPVGNSQDVPMVVLIGKDTVSFGEIMSGILQDIGRARLVGVPTAGNVETLHSHVFEDGSRLWLAQERFEPRVTHANWEGVGVQPDVRVDSDWSSTTLENDPAIAAAVGLLAKK